jgi:hypothetical protein
VGFQENQRQFPVNWSPKKGFLFAHQKLFPYFNFNKPKSCNNNFIDYFIDEGKNEVFLWRLRLQEY